MMVSFPRGLRHIVLLAVASAMIGCSEPEPPYMVGRLAEVMAPQRMPEGAEDYIVDVTSSEFDVLYGERLEPGSFRARINGKDVTAAFQPQPGRFERVKLNVDLPLGRNELVFEAAPRHTDGRTGRVRKYTVALNREVQPRQPSLVPMTGGILSEPPPAPPAGR